MLTHNKVKVSLSDATKFKEWFKKLKLFLKMFPIYIYIF